MALHERTESAGTFLTVKKGAICLERKLPETPAELERLLSEGWVEDEGDVDGRPYHKLIKKFASVDGRITKIEWYDREVAFGRRRGLHLRLKDNGDNFTLDLAFEKKPFDFFTKVAENIDYTQPVEFIAWPDREDSKKTNFACKQNGKWVQWKYKKDDMGECPPAVQSKVTGKWNFDTQREWLLERLLTVVAPMAEAANAFDEPEPEYAPEEPSPVTIQNVAKAATAANDAVKRTNKAKAASAEPPMPPFDPQDEDVPDDMPF